MLVRCVPWPASSSWRAHSAANSSALPVCDAHTTTTGCWTDSAVAGLVSGAAEPSGTAERENSPAIRPSSHTLFDPEIGAVRGRTGTPCSSVDCRPARSPARYVRSCSSKLGDAESSSPRMRLISAAGEPLARVRAPPDSGTSGSDTGATRVRETAHTLNSGWKDVGSTASLVTALMLRYSPNESFQWNGAKQLLAARGR